MARKTWDERIGSEITGMGAAVLFLLVLFAAILLCAAITAAAALHPTTQMIWSVLGIGSMGAFFLWSALDYPTPKREREKAQAVVKQQNAYLDEIAQLRGELEQCTRAKDEIISRTTTEYIALTLTLRDILAGIEQFAEFSAEDQRACIVWIDKRASEALAAV
jgi:4-amino-4-deoxy-L-arabinose transferase-like glycosyltransferase